MAQCTLIYPGLLGPDIPLEELPDQDWPDKTGLPRLSLLLNRGRPEPIARQAFEAHILSALGYVIADGDELPVAAIRRSDAGVSDTPVWCLDPVHVQIDREMAYLADSQDLAITEPEAQQLIASLNAHFSDTLQIEYFRPHQWLVQTSLRLATRTPSDAVLQDIRSMLPSGPDAQRWRSLVNEIQMLLHNHPVNEARLAAGKRPVNSVWLWGGGKNKTLTPACDIVYADDALIALAAARNKILHISLPQQIDATLFRKPSVLLVVTDQLPALWRKDVYAWLAGLNQLEHTLLAPLVSLLESGELARLVVQSDSMRLSLTRKDIHKWWRRTKSIKSMFLTLRKQYGR